jgi:hypothetical protein
MPIPRTSVPRAEPFRSSSQDPAAQVPTDQLQHPPVPDHLRDPAHQNVVLDPVEELLNVEVHRPGFP